MGHFGLTESRRDLGGRTIQVLGVAGELDAHTFPQFQERVERLIGDGSKAIVIDFKHLDYISSAGLGVLKKIVNETRSGGGDIRLAALSQKIHNIVNLLGFTKIFQVFSTVDEAASSYLPSSS
jgi:anti-sigma B factor antagonist